MFLCMIMKSLSRASNHKTKLIKVKFWKLAQRQVFSIARVPNKLKQRAEGLTKFDRLPQLELCVPKSLFTSCIVSESPNHSYVTVLYNNSSRYTPANPARQICSEPFTRGEILLCKIYWNILQCSAAIKLGNFSIYARFLGIATVIISER